MKAPAMADRWVIAAMADDSMVAEVLLGFSSEPSFRNCEVIPTRWGRRLPRSKLPSDFTSSEARKRKEGECSARCSPTTPLSWSGGSPSTPDGGFDETNYFCPSSTRSKVNGDLGSCGSNKQKKKKVNSAELKEKESLLLSERSNLKKKIATAQASWEQERAQNVMLKKMKVDLKTIKDSVVTCSSDAAAESRGERAAFAFDLNMMPPEEPFLEILQQIR